MGEHTSKAFTADKLKKFAVSGAGVGSRDRDSEAQTDDYGRKAARSSDSSAFAEGGAAKAPSLGRAGRAGGGRVGRANGGKTRDINQVTDAGPHRYGEEPLIRAKGGRIGRQNGGPGSVVPRDADLGGDADQPGFSDMQSAVRAGRARYSDELSRRGRSAGDYPEPNRAKGGRISRAKGGRAKGKTVVNVIVGDKDRGQQPPPPMPPMMPPPPPPQAAAGPVPPRPPMPMPMPGAAGPAGPAGPPGAGLPPGLPPGLPGRARGGRINERYGSGSGLGRMANAKRENSGKVKLAE